MKLLFGVVAVAVAVFLGLSSGNHDESALLTDFSNPPPWPIFIGVNVIASIFRGIADALTPPPIRMLDMANGYHSTVLVYTAQKFKIPDMLSQSAMTAKEISATINGSTDAAKVDLTERYMFACVANGIFQLSPTEDGTPRFVNSALSAVLRRDHPNAMAGFVGHSFEDMYKAWFELPGMFGKDSHPLAWDAAFPEYPTSKGGIWALYEAIPEREEQFGRAMSAIEGLGGEAMVLDGPFEKFNRVVDIGGSRGHFLHRILDHYPETSGVLFDRPPVIQNAKEAWAAGGQYADVDKSRITFAEGSFFDLNTMPKIEDGDAVYMRYILHDWPIAEVDSILQNVRDSMGSKNATLLIGECALPNHDTVGVPPSMYNIDIQMMVAFKEGKERTPSEWEALLNKHGFKIVAIHATRSLVHWVEAVPV